MDNPKLFLLKRIAGHETNGFPSLGEFDAKHFDDVCKLMLEFAKECISETIEQLNKGQAVVIDDMRVSLNKPKRYNKK